MLKWKIKRRIDLACDAPAVERLKMLATLSTRVAHELRITVQENKKDAVLDGLSVKLSMILSDGSSLLDGFDGTIQNSTAVITLPDICYSQTGEVKGVLYLADNSGSMMPIYAFVLLNFVDLTDVFIDTANVVPSLSELLMQMQTMREVTAEASAAADAARKAAQSANFVVLGRYDTYAQLRAAHYPGENGQAYAVGSVEENEVYVWSADEVDWVSIGAVQGPAGFSPEVKIEAIPGGNRVTITDAKGSVGFDVPVETEVLIRPLVSIKTQDCILIQAGGKNILCDTGTLSVEEDPDAPAVLLGKLRALGVEHVDVIYISHYHSDHAGLPELVAAGLDITGATLILPQAPDLAVVGSGTNKQYTNIINLVETHDLTVKIPTEKERVQLNGDDTYFEFYNTDHTEYYAMAEFDYNNCSLCAMLVHGSKRVFFSGDLAMAGQAALVGKVPKADLYKIEHHGLNAKFNRDYYATLTPSMCFTSNGWGDAGRTSTYIHSRSAVQAYLERMGIPNFCTHDNENLCFVVGRDSIEVQGRSFNEPTNIVNHTSMMSAVDADYSSVATVKAMSFKELCLGMKPDSHLVTQIDSSFAIWEMVSPFVSDSISSATLDIHKVSSSDIRGALDVVTGYFHIYPRSTDSFTVGMLFGSFYYNPNASTPTFGATIKQLNPSQVHYFKWNQETLMFVPETYSGKAFTVNENGEILSTYSGLAKIWVTVTNNGSEDKTYTLEDSANSGSNRVRATAKCAAGCTASMAHMESVSASSILAIKADGALLSSDDDVRVMIESMNRYQSHYLYTEEDVTGDD